jgi:hypothetical protein
VCSLGKKRPYRLNLGRTCGCRSLPCVACPVSDTLRSCGVGQTSQPSTQRSRCDCQKFKLQKAVSPKSLNSANAILVRGRPGTVTKYATRSCKSRSSGTWIATHSSTSRTNASVRSRVSSDSSLARCSPIDENSFHKTPTPLGDRPLTGFRAVLTAIGNVFQLILIHFALPPGRTPMNAILRRKLCHTISA